MDRGTLPLAEHYENRLRLTEAYDRAGIYSYHVAEHHSTPLGMAPSPSVFLSAVAQRTKRLRLGPLIYPLPLHHPLRVTEEICMLDHLSRGRLDVGIGRGAVPYEIEYYGADPKEAQARYMEAYAVIVKALTGPVLNHKGKFFEFTDVPMEIMPLQQPRPPFWYGAVNEDGAVWAAKNRINIVCNAPLDVVRTIIQRYRKEWLAAGNDMADIPLMGMNRYVMLADSDREAQEIAERAYQVWKQCFYYLWNKRGGTPTHVTALYPPTFAEAQQKSYAIAGSPKTVRRVLTEQVAEAGNNYTIVRFAFGDLSLNESLRSLALFEREVMPALSEMRAAAE
jgi:alkanesulfonate monooxygenase SsuD/methylene tetrahydromethanopterin reductase-like flavin-dependent oxidoreductase (luciferase family)